MMNREDYTMNFRFRLKYLRDNAKMTQRDLAEKVDTTLSTISKYELGATEPNISMLVKLARTFGVSVDYLIGSGDNPIPHGSGVMEANLDQDYVYLMGSNGQRRKIYIPPEKTERFRALICAAFPELMEE